MEPDSKCLMGLKETEGGGKNPKQPTINRAVLHCNGRKIRQGQQITCLGYTFWSFNVSMSPCCFFGSHATL